MRLIFNRFTSTLKQWTNRFLHPNLLAIERALEDARRYRNSRQFSRQKKALIDVLKLDSKHALAYRELFVVLRRLKTSRDEYLNWLERYESATGQGQNHVFRLMYYRTYDLWPEWNTLLAQEGLEGDAHLLEQERFTAEIMNQFPIEDIIEKLHAIVALAKSVDCEEMTNIIIEHAKEKRPFYLDRVSDGEGTFIGLYNEFNKTRSLSKRSEHAYQLITRLVFKENSLGHNDLPVITRPLIQAYLNAPALILPDEKRLRATVQRDWRGYFGLASAVEHLHDNLSALRAQYFMVGNDFRNLATRANILKLVNAHPFIGLITCHATLKHTFESLGAKDVRLIHIPAEALSLPVEQRKAADQLYPERHASVLSEIAQKDQPRLFFVGAGILAKQYCAALYDAGHMAIDLGSAVDKWLGISKRTDANTTVDEKYIL